MSAQHEGRLNRSSGFTLVELITVLVLVVVVGLGVVLSLTRTNEQTWLRTDTMIASNTSAQRALDRLTADLRRAKRQFLRCDPQNVNNPVDDVLQFYPLNNTPQVSYFVTAGTLYREQGGTPLQVAASGITAFQPVCAANAELVQILLTARVKGLAGTMDQTLMTQVRAQNP